MVIYLAGPMESDPETGKQFRQEVKLAFANEPNLAQYSLFDPAQAYCPSALKTSNQVRGIRNMNRNIIKRCHAMLVYLGGQETWREIEFARQKGTPVYGILPYQGEISPVAVADFSVYNSIEEFIAEFCQE